MNRKFWSLKRADANAFELRIEGEIAAEESWLYDTVTPKAFRDELAQVEGDITVWINSPGGEVFAASAIYTALKDHPGKITVKIDGIAASAASMIAMAGDQVLMSPTSAMMIHNPMTYAVGDSREMQHTARMLDELRDGFVAAYVSKTGMTSDEITVMLDDETWLNAESAVNKGFADEIMFIEHEEPVKAYAFNRRRIMALARAPLDQELNARTNQSTTHQFLPANHTHATYNEETQNPTQAERDIILAQCREIMKTIKE